MITTIGDDPNLFPLVRHLSGRLTPVLLRLPVTPNQITTASLVLGLLAAWMFAIGERSLGVAGGLALSLSYILDNCDGEVARAKNLRSDFGRHLDDAADWIVHAAIFLAIGHAAHAAFGNLVWWWFGIAAAGGASLNYFVVRIQDLMSGPAMLEDDKLPVQPTKPLEFAVFMFRELFRADFCFVLLVLATFDAAWLVLPLAAVGAQVYWLAAFAKGASHYHV